MATTYELRKALYKTIEDEANITGTTAQIIAFDNSSPFAVELYIEIAGTINMLLSIDSNGKYSVNLNHYSSDSDIQFSVLDDETAGQHKVLIHKVSSDPLSDPLGSIKVRKEIKYGIIENPSIQNSSSIPDSWISVQNYVTQLENLIVNGNTEFTGNVDINNSTSIDGTTIHLGITGTDNAIDFDTSSLAIEAVNTTINGTNLNITLETSYIDSDVNITGLVDIDGSLNVDNINLDLNKITTLADDLTIDSATNETIIDSNTTITGTLDTTGAAEFDSTVGIDGNVRVGNAGAYNFTVSDTGNVYALGSLKVDGSTQLDGATTINNTLTVTGENITTLNGAVDINNSVEISKSDGSLIVDTETISLDATNTSNLSVKGNIDDTVVLNISSENINAGTNAFASMVLSSDDSIDIDSNSIAMNATNIGLTGQLKIDGNTAIDGSTLVVGREDDLTRIELNTALLDIDSTNTTIDGTDLTVTSTNINMIGTLGVNGVSTFTGDISADGGINVDDSFVVADDGVLTTDQNVRLKNAADFTIFSDDLLTPKFKISGANGEITAGGDLYLDSDDIDIDTRVFRIDTAGTSNTIAFQTSNFDVQDAITTIDSSLTSNFTLSADTNSARLMTISATNANTGTLAEASINILADTKIIINSSNIELGLNKDDTQTMVLRAATLTNYSDITNIYSSTINLGATTNTSTNIKGGTINLESLNGFNITGESIFSGNISADAGIDVNDKFDVDTNGNILTTGTIKTENLTDSTSVTDGALVVSGGVGIAKKLTVGEVASLDGGINVNNLFTVDTSGDTIIHGNLTVQGTNTILNTTTVTTTDDIIQLRSNASTSMTGYAGLVASKYDGDNDGALVYDKDGTAWVGDVTINGDGSISNISMQPIATRDIATSLTGTGLAIWDSNSSKFITSQNLTFSDDGLVVDTLLLNGNTLGTSSTGGTIEIVDNTSINGTLDVSGATTINGSLTVVGNTTIDESAQIANSDSFTLTFNGRNSSAAQVNGSLKLDGPTSRLQFNDADIVTISSTDTLTNKTLINPVLDTSVTSSGDLFNLLPKNIVAPNTTPIVDTLNIGVGDFTVTTGESITKNINIGTGVDNITSTGTITRKTVIGGTNITIGSGSSNVSIPGNLNVAGDVISSGTVQYTSLLVSDSTFLNSPLKIIENDNIFFEIDSDGNATIFGTLNVGGKITGSLNGNADNATVADTVLTHSVATGTFYPTFVDSNNETATAESLHTGSLSYNAATNTLNATTFVGSFSGNLDGEASSVTDGVYITDTGTVTNTMLAGSIANNKLANSTISGISLGSDLATLTIGAGLNGTSYNGSSAVTIAHSNSITAGTIDEGGAARILTYGGTFNIPSVTYDSEGHITETSTITLTLPSSDNTNTTYSVKASSQTGGAGLDLDAGGSGSGTDTVKFLGDGATTVTRTDVDTITISSVDTNTWRTVEVNNTSIGSGTTLDLTNGTDISLSNTSGVVKFELNNSITTSAITAATDSNLVLNSGAHASNVKNISLNTTNGGSINLNADTTIGGSLTVNGTINYLNQTILEVEDKTIKLAVVDTPNETTALGSGIVIEAGTTDKTFSWNNTDNTAAGGYNGSKWEANGKKVIDETDNATYNKPGLVKMSVDTTNGIFYISNDGSDVPSF